MPQKTFEELVYVINKAKDIGKAPIFFLGAGASMSAGIPRSGQIIADAFTEYSGNPRLHRLSEQDKQDYATVMDGLLPDERKSLFNRYIADAKINVTHIYLAQLMKEGFADYVLTVNFDNLMLRALALYNAFPPVYDIAIIKERTTDTFQAQSVIYLHGLHHSDWLLNTPDEMSKVTESVLRVFDTIKDGRPWVFIGYSGSDPVFDNLCKVAARFNQGLYWVGNGDKPLPVKVKDFISTPNLNAHHIKGFDADSFMLKLSNSLGIEQPKLLDKPFHALLDVLNNIVDIDDADHFKGVKERLEIAKKQTQYAIDQNSAKIPLTSTSLSQALEADNPREVDQLNKQLIDLIISDKFDNTSEVEAILSRATKLNNPKTNELTSSVYNNWGIELCNSANTKTGKEQENLFRRAVSTHQQAIALNPKNNEAYNNLGVTLDNLARSKLGTEQEDLFQQAIHAYQQAIALNPEQGETYSNLGYRLMQLAKTIGVDVSNTYWQQAKNALEKAAELGGGSYNLACWHALQQQKAEAFHHLKIALENNEITIDHLVNDDDWKLYRDDLDFLQLLQQSSLSKLAPERFY
jgi:tetratricopeptide (TPR) repeat protein